MSRCPSCGEALSGTSVAFCDQCGARLQSGLLLLGVSLGQATEADTPAPLAKPEPDPAPARFVPFASRRALRHAR